MQFPLESPAIPQPIPKKHAIRPFSMTTPLTADFMSLNSPPGFANPMATSPTPPPLLSSPSRIPMAPPSPPSSPSDIFSLLAPSYPYANGTNPLTSKLTQKQLGDSV